MRRQVGDRGRSLVESGGGCCLQSHYHLVVGELADIAGLPCGEVHFGEVALVVMLAQRPEHAPCARVDGGVGAVLGFHAGIADKGDRGVFLADSVQLGFDAYVFYAVEFKIFAYAVKLACRRACYGGPPAREIAQQGYLGLVFELCRIGPEVNGGKLQGSADFHDAVDVLAHRVVCQRHRGVAGRGGEHRLPGGEAVTVVVHECVSHERSLVAGVIQVADRHAAECGVDLVGEHALECHRCACGHREKPRLVKLIPVRLEPDASVEVGHRALCLELRGALPRQGHRSLAGQTFSGGVQAFLHEYVADC